MTTAPFTNWYMGYVSAREGVDANGTGKPDMVRYAITVFDPGPDIVPEITLTLPTVRRHGGFSARVVAAAVGHPCIITIAPDGSFQVYPLTEYDAFKPCNGEGGGGDGTGSNTGGGPPPPPPPGGPNTKVPPGGGIGGGPVSEF